MFPDRSTTPSGHGSINDVAQGPLPAASALLPTPLSRRAGIERSLDTAGTSAPRHIGCPPRARLGFGDSASAPAGPWRLALRRGVASLPHLRDRPREYFEIRRWPRRSGWLSPGRWPD